MFSPLLNKGFLLVTVMVLMLIMSMVSLFCMEMTINDLKTRKYCHKMNTTEPRPQGSVQVLNDYRSKG